MSVWERLAFLLSFSYSVTRKCKNKGAVGTIGILSSGTRHSFVKKGITLKQSM
jgi:hypothetical protein